MQWLKPIGFFSLMRSSQSSFIYTYHLKKMTNFEESTFPKWHFFGRFYSPVILHSIRLSNLFLSKWLYTFWRRMDKKVSFFSSWFFCTSFSHQAVLLMQDSFKKALFNLAIYYSIVFPKKLPLNDHNMSGQARNHFFKEYNYIQ